ESTWTAAFRDFGAVSAWAKPYIAFAADQGLIKGGTDGAFSPKALTTRAEAAAAVYNFVLQEED
ncbi:S-layer homology domain-containing protein, partial [Paenibacillus sepulcri]|nr:S-layer homology domain-containing protein [Paenibacillus sepulcri]